MSDFVREFLIEARELVERAVADLLALERAPGDAARLESAFRSFHTLKGAAGIMEYSAMERLVHGGEDMLQALKVGGGEVSHAVVNDCLARIDLLNLWLDIVQATGDMPATADADVDQLLASRGSVSGATALTSHFREPAAVTSGDPSRSLTDIALAIVGEQIAMLESLDDPDARAGRIGSAGRTATNVLAAGGRSADASRVEQASREAVASGSAARLIAALEGIGRPAPQIIAAASDGLEEVATTVRVDVARIDALVDLTGELLVVKNALAHWARRAGEGEDIAIVAAALKTQQAVLERQLGELQRAALALRVLPLSRVFSRFPRLVRDTAARLGKQVSFATQGETVEADKAIVESLFEPLLHVIRNAIDHGVEPAEVRERAGKSVTASIIMRGWRDGDRVLVEVADDGRGIDPEAVRRIAETRGLGSAADLAKLTDEDAADLIFAPGFSTAAEVTDLSGRGVGMDAVRSAIMRLGGDVSTVNQVGQGLTVRFSLPFTIMLTSVMTVEAGGQMFGIPFDAVIETVRVPRSRIRDLGGGRAFVLRDQTIPVVNLAESLGLSIGRPSADDVCIVVALADGAPVGVEIDRPGDRIDMMLKPMEGLLAGMRGVSGASLLGDGRVLIVLDLPALVSSG